MAALENENTLGEDIGSFRLTFQSVGAVAEHGTAPCSAAISTCPSNTLRHLGKSHCRNEVGRFPFGCCAGPVPSATSQLVLSRYRFSPSALLNRPFGRGLAVPTPRLVSYSPGSQFCTQRSLGPLF